MTKKELNFQGRFHVEHRDRDGKLKGKYSFHNDVTNIGKDTILGVMFHDVSAIASTGWYIGLINSDSYTGTNAADIMSSHAGWTYFTSHDSTRQQWGPGASSGQTVTNAVAATFDINGNGTVKGIFVTTGSAKDGTSGVLWSTGLFGSEVAVVSGDQLKITYSIGC
jgi:hypothetical protein